MAFDPQQLDQWWNQQVTAQAADIAEVAEELGLKRAPLGELRRVDTGSAPFIDLRRHFADLGMRLNQPGQASNLVDQVVRLEETARSCDMVRFVEAYANTHCALSVLGNQRGRDGDYYSAASGAEEALFRFLKSYALPSCRIGRGS